MKLALVRHGQTDWNIQRRYQGWEGLDLNETGRSQAVDAAERLLGIGADLGAQWRWLSSSTSPRAMQTAQIIGDRLPLVPGDLQFEDLRERGFGIAEGMLIEEARTRWPARDYPGGETTEAVLERALRGLDAVAAAHDGLDGVLVTHGTTLRLVVGHLTGEDPGSLPNGAIAVLDRGPGGWRTIVHPSGTTVSEQVQGR
ncbi:histidine phosphatase family protein [Cellulomonas pakistanensis]|uniref:Phosphoglycerate mutase n=1 Tax=Cellulomonas pakistanensis TaxID=992287 RepID=A0A919U3F1_9CELL|nr:histidine phosphatase family protein [Cellulomonas pakistanensis]GIG36236.1 phosphoglycerate mutase [Cellulomonas pakistanensis]